MKSNNTMKPYITKAALCLLMAISIVFSLATVVSASGSTTISTTAEEFGEAPCTVKVDVGSSFSDAAVVSINGNGQETGAVVDEGYIEFYVTEHGGFTVKDTGETVESMSLTGNLESTSPEVTCRGAGNGTAEQPLTILADFANLASDVQKLQATWKSFNVFAGFDTTGTTARDTSSVKKILVEDRDTETGRLLGSFYIDGALWEVTQSADKGPYYMNYLLDPADEYITSGYALDNHYSYTSNAVGGAERKELALELLKSVRDSDDSALFVQSRLREYAGPITYTIYVGDLGKFESGDTVGITYLLGSSNRNIYHGIKPDFETLLEEEPTYSQYYQDVNLTAVVDEDGYLTFTLYNGGYFALTRVTGSDTAAVWEMPDYSDIDNETDSSTGDIYFTDVPLKHWAYIDIYAMAQEGIINGYSDGTFKPSGNITRAEFVKLLITALNIQVQTGDTDFNDVQGHWAGDYIYTACKLGITSGLSDTEFGVNERITREQMVVMICKAKDITPFSTDGFTDDEQVSDWAKGYIGACADAKYVSGYEDGSFRPQNVLTRAEAAAVIHKIYNIG